MSKLPRAEKAARIIRVDTLDGIAVYAHTVQESTWEMAVHAAMRGDLVPAMEKLLEGKVPPPKTRAALEQALARLKRGRKGRPPKGQPPRYLGPLAKRERGRTPLLRAVRKYKELRALGLGKGEAEKLAVEWANTPLQNPPNKLIDARMRSKVTVNQLRVEIRSGNVRRKLMPL